jgi:hypothetical protein
MSASARKQWRIDYVVKARTEAETAMIIKREQFRELWNIFQNIQDHSRKADWQSRVFIPKTFTRVIRGSSVIKNALLEGELLFKFNADLSEIDDKLMKLEDGLTAALEAKDIEIAGRMREEIVRLTDQKRQKQAQATRIEKAFKRKLAETNFISIYGEAATSGMLLGLMDPKVIWDFKGEKAQWENVDILNLLVSPRHEPHSGRRPPYIIQRKEMTLTELRKIAKETNEAAGKAIFDFEAIDQIKGSKKQIDNKYHDLQRKGFQQFTDAADIVEIWEFWGDIPSKDNLTVDENQVLMTTTDNLLIYDNPNPFDHEKTPHNLTYPMTYPHRGTTGISLVEPAVGLQYLYNNITNMGVDNLNWSVNKVFEYDPTLLKHPTDMHSIHPGKTVATSGAGTNAVMREVVTSSTLPEVNAALEMVNREIDEATNVNEFVAGRPGRAKTKGEVQIKTAESRGLFETMARDVEQHGLKPALEKCYDLYAQFDGMTKRDGVFNIQVGGITLLLSKERLEANLSETLFEALSSPVLGQMTDIPTLWKKKLTINNFGDAFKDPQARPRSPQELVGIEQQGAQDATQQLQGLSDEEIVQVGGQLTQ